MLFVHLFLLFFWSVLFFIAWQSAFSYSHIMDALFSFRMHFMAEFRACQCHWSSCHLPNCTIMIKKKECSFQLRIYSKSFGHSTAIISIFMKSPPEQVEYAMHIFHVSLYHLCIINALWHPYPNSTPVSTVSTTEFLLETIKMIKTNYNLWTNM